MATKGGKPENLIPQSNRTKEQQREIASLGGKRSAEVKREKKLLSTIYAEMLAGRFDVTDELGKTEKIEGQEYMRRVASAILSRNDSAAVSMLKEIREATEGNALKIAGNISMEVKPIDTSILTQDQKDAIAQLGLANMSKDDE